MTGRRVTARPAHRAPRCQVAAVVALAATALLGGCADHDPPPPLGAAEPAAAPPTTTAPTGDVVAVGGTPQGIVYDARTDLLAVAVRRPDRLLLLDPRTLAGRTSVPLPGGVRHLQLAAPGGPVLVPVETADQLVEVSLPDGATVATAVGRQPHDAAGVGDGDVVVGNELGGSLSIVHDGSVLRTFGDLQQPGGVVVDGTTAVVVDVGAFTLSTYDVDTARRRGRIPAGEGPTHAVLIAPHRVVVADTRGGELLVDDLDPLREVASIDVGGSPYGLAADPATRTVWVTLTATNEVVGLDTTEDTPRVIARYPTVRQPDTVAVAPGSHTLWITSTADGVVQRIER
jgi:DNA-binding beta-propeller fold protein YncE